MAVYVDKLFLSRDWVGRFPEGCRECCHMMADTDEKLEMMRKAIGLRRSWLQTDRYDLTANKRRLAVLHGAARGDGPDPRAAAAGAGGDIMSREGRIALCGGDEQDILTRFRRLFRARRGMARFAKNHYRRGLRYAGRAEVRQMFREIRDGPGREML